ncbi:hypothetical protein P152DRAFT_474743 [Eremomyces bilateralis CBS 781.70]|uniref:Uncharacterized protein n=1 Tax=Eremomyces bilateralis CBS 781.70 TaxID=1392243 RepID=A0A6G1G0Y8_9PEZI|nr:uncharacterized protein P152DRAFT_474743 [Eremomyces bilateralis CBS 781.70]KAF1811591.1 hypothetical protein P152DRAFT_474743 [Eremomyces bilateralis CBS 781.70]
MIENLSPVFKTALPCALRSSPRKSLSPQGGRNTLLAVALSSPARVMTDYFGRSIADTESQERRIQLNAYLKDQLSQLKRPDVRALLDSRRAAALHGASPVISSFCHPERPPAKELVSNVRMLMPSPGTVKSILKPSGTFARKAAARVARVADASAVDVITDMMEKLTIQDSPLVPRRASRVRWADLASKEKRLVQQRLITNWQTKVDVVPWEVSQLGLIRQTKIEEERGAEIAAVSCGFVDGKCVAGTPDVDLVRENKPQVKSSRVLRHVLLRETSARRWHSHRPPTFFEKIRPWCIGAAAVVAVVSAFTLL